MHIYSNYHSSYLHSRVSTCGALEGLGGQEVRGLIQLGRHVERHHGVVVQHHQGVDLQVCEVQLHVEPEIEREAPLFELKKGCLSSRKLPLLHA